MEDEATTLTSSRSVTTTGEPETRRKLELSTAMSMVETWAMILGVWSIRRGADEERRCDCVGDEKEKDWNSRESWLVLNIYIFPSCRIRRLKTSPPQVSHPHRTDGITITLPNEFFCGDSIQG